MTLRILFQKLKGGPGSGNFGHEGRPGKKGGSKSSTGGSIMEPTKAELRWFDSLTQEEKDALFNYANAGSANINAKLRAGEKVDTGYLDSAISKAPKAGKGIYLYRATYPDAPILDKGYTSAMKEPKYAEPYANMGRVVRKFKVPEGTPIAPISLIYRQWIPSAGSQEVLLPRIK